MRTHRLAKPLTGPFCAAALAAAAMPGMAHAGFVNGDFETGDFTGWSQDTDGSGAPTPLSPDFQVVNAGGSNKARIEADYWSSQGDNTSTPLDQVFFSNTLFQGLDTAVAPGFELLLSFDWEFGGQKAAPDEDVIIGLGDGSGDLYGADGNLGFLVSETGYGSGSFSAVLAPSFDNAAGWTADFQINAGSDAFGSYLSIDNVAIVQQPKAAAPEPAFLFAPALLLLAAMRRRAGAQS